MRIVFHLSTQTEVEVKRQGDPDERHGEGGEQPSIATIAPEQCERPQQVELLCDRERPCEVEVVLSSEKWPVQSKRLVVYATAAPAGAKICQTLRCAGTGNARRPMSSTTTVAAT